jgi:hypothetical protein
MDNQIQFLNEKSCDGITHWLYQQWYLCQQKKQEAIFALSACTVEEDVLHAEWAAQVQEQTKPLPYKLAHISISIALTGSSSRWLLGQSCDQAFHAINNILALEKSLTLLNENICSLELQLIRNAFVDGSDVPQELESSCLQHG